MIKTIFKLCSLGLVLSILSTPALSVEAKKLRHVNITEFSKQLQTQKITTKHIRLAFWLPNEYWGVALRMQPGVPSRGVKSLERKMSKYVTFALINADLSPLGTFDFHSEQTIKQNSRISFIDSNGVRRNLRPVTNPDPSITTVLQMMKPILSSAAGKMGQNFHFMVYKDVDRNNQRLISPYKEGAIMISFTNKDGSSPSTLTIDTLVDALHIPRKCSNGKNAHVSWKYCPWDGRRLPN